MVAGGRGASGEESVVEARTLRCKALVRRLLGSGADSSGTATLITSRLHMGHVLCLRSHSSMQPTQ